jgi:hypothetical protein
MPPAAMMTSAITAAAIEAIAKPRLRALAEGPEGAGAGVSADSLME